MHFCFLLVACELFKKWVQLITKMTFLIIQKSSISKSIFKTLKHEVFIFLSGSMPVYVQGFQVYCCHAPDIELLVLGVLFHSSFIMVFHEESWILQLTSSVSSWIYEIARGNRHFGVLLLFPVCLYGIQSALDSKCRAILSYFFVTKINCLRKLLMKLHWLNLGFKINVSLLTPYLYYVEL